MEIIDLRAEPKGCKEHPLIKLKRKISNMVAGEEIRVILDTSLIPLKTIEIIASRNKLKLVIDKQNNNIYEIILKKI